MQQPPPRPVSEVLIDQVKWLIEYASSCDEGEGCPECGRLRQVAPVLLRPFLRERQAAP